MDHSEGGRSPGSSVFGNEDYALRGPDGTVYILDSQRGTVEIRKAEGTLLIGDSGVTALGGDALRFLYDSRGNISQVTDASGRATVYSHDGEGRLTAVRDLVSGAGVRYGYVDGRLALEVPSSGAGKRIVYNPDGTVTTVPVASDLATPASFTGRTIAGDLGAGGEQTFAFTLRESELEGLPNAFVLLRVETAGDVTPDIDGLTPIASATSGGKRVTLFALADAGLHALRIAGSGAFSFEMRAAGDINGDARVDGLDSAAVVAAIVGSDISGDGVTNATDNQLVAANYGFRGNTTPTIAASIPVEKTHVDLQRYIDLTKLATDPDGDRLYYRIAGATGGTATLTADGLGVLFTPTTGYAGAASIRFSADDGFGSSAEGTVDITVSDSPLLSLAFSVRQPYFDEVGEDGRVQLIGQFADQADVLLPYSYVTASVGNSDVIRLGSDGTMLALKEGATYLKAQRGDIAAATTVTVGDPTTATELMTQIYGINAYPDAVTLLPNGGTRSIIASLDPNEEYFVNGAAAGTTYVSADSAIVTVDANGLMRGVGAGSTFVTVINGFAEDRVLVTVALPVIGDSVVIDAESGAIVQNSDGIQIAFGPGALSGDATVTIDTLTQAELGIPMPNTPSLSFLSAFDFQVNGAILNDTVQLAVPVPAGTGNIGDQVWFFVKKSLPVGENGAMMDVWTVVDSGTIDADGMARAKSPPFPGLSDRGQVLIARAAQPIPTLRINVGFSLAVAMAFAPAIGIGAVGGLAGAVVSIGMVGAALSMIAFPLFAELATINLYKQYAGREDIVRGVDLDPAFTTTQLNSGATIVADFPPEEFQDEAAPIITEVIPTLLQGAGTAIEIRGRNLLQGSPATLSGNKDNVRVVLTQGTQRTVLGSDRIQIVANGAGDFSIAFIAPTAVIMGAAKITIERPTVLALPGPDGGPSDSTEYVSSTEFTVDNKSAHAFVGSYQGVQVIDRKLGFETEQEQDFLIRQIPLDAAVKDIVVTSDLGVAFAATNKGIAVIDTFTLSQYDVVRGTAPIDMIQIPGGAVTALAVDTENGWLYAAGLGKVYVININPGRANYLKVVESPETAIDMYAESRGERFGHITSMALNADNTRLYIGVPVSEMYGSRMWINQANRDPGLVMVLNVKEADRPAEGDANVNGWRTVIDKINAGIEVFDIQPTAEPEFMTFVSRGDRNRGIKFVEAIANSNRHTVTDMRTLTMGQEIAVFAQPASIGGFVFWNDYRRSTDTGGFAIGKANDLNVHNASGVAVTPDLQYMFVADWGVPSLYLTRDMEQAQLLDEFYNIGSKILVIKDPFGANREIIGATTPIPFAFLEDLRIDSSGKKLYANYRGAGNIVIIDIDEIRTIEADDDFTRIAIDNPNWGYDIYEEAVDVLRHGRGMALQTVMALDLLGPTGLLDLHADNPPPLVFKWEIDATLLPAGPDLKTSFFLSTQTQGDGLWPDDPIRERGLTSLNPAWQGEDNHPSRIYTVFDLTGGKWRIKADGTPEFVSDLLPGQFELEFDPAYARSLTGGQTYFWGVEAEQFDLREFTAFKVPVNVVNAPFNGVTVLTHGFALQGLVEGSGGLLQPGEFKEMGRLIAESGDGVTLLYDKNHGSWVDMATMTTITGQQLIARYAGKPVVLVNDWVQDSVISDGGFSEAAADAIFAAIIRLNEEAGGAILGSPLHFIGHSRGTSVNSEIIQRLGWYRPDVTGIHMTALDPHDFKQESLDVPIGTVLTVVKAAVSFYALVQLAYGVGSAVAAAGSAIASGGAFLPAAGALLSSSGTALLAAANSAKLAVRIQSLQSFAERLRLQIDPIAYADLLDPDIKLWSNIGFSENYYQEAASPTGLGMTPNGRDIGATSISRNFTGYPVSTAGFDGDDFIAFGAGGPHSRIWQWYAGTIDTNMTEFLGVDIYRRITDDGLRPDVFGLPVLRTFNDQPWYFVTPEEITGSAGQRIGGANQQLMDAPANAFDFQITDGIGMGWFYSPTGGGLDVRPSTGAGNVAVTVDNTDGAQPGGVGVQSVFNGDFEQGTRQSLSTFLEQYVGGEFPDGKGRFPLSYELPGFSMHGGMGFILDLLGTEGFSAGSIDLDALTTVDVGGMFTINTNPAALIKQALVKVWEDFFDGQFLLASKFKLGLSSRIAFNAAEKLLAKKVKNWTGLDVVGKTELINKYLSAIDKVAGAANTAIESVDTGLKKLVDATGIVPDFGPDGADEEGLDKFKAAVSKKIEEGFDLLFPNQDNYALIMGGGALLANLVDSFFPDNDVFNLLKAEIKRILPGLNSITHNYLYVPTDKPYLTFKVYKPYMLQAGATVRVTFEGSGLPPIDAVVANQVPGSRQVDLGTGFFTSSEFSVEVPAAYKGKSATITIRHENMAPPQEFKDAIADPTIESQLLEAVAALELGISQTYLLDDIRFTNVAAVDGVMPGTPQVAEEGEASDAAAVPPVTLEQVASLFDAARQLWVAAGISEADALKLAGLELKVVSHQGAALATYSDNTIAIDADAAGHGWFVDATPQGSSEFANMGGRLLATGSSNLAVNRYDLLTVIVHEMGHALGLTEAPAAIAPRVMSESLSLGERRLPGIADLPVVSVGTTSEGALPPTITLSGTGVRAFASVAAFAIVVPGTPATEPLRNGDFALGEGWDATGGGVVSGGVGVLAEDARFLSSLSQKFLLPNGATEISFRVRSAALGANADMPPDAFEAALLDPVTGNSLLAPLVGLDLSDALLNLQADGTLRLAPNVTVVGSLLAGTATVTISLDGVDRSNGAVLSFDLIGMGDLDSRVVIDDVSFTAVANNVPVAGPDSASGNEDADIVIDLLANDSDADGDVLSVAILAGPASGTLIAPSTPGEAWTYRPNTDFAGADSFTYSITDGLSAPVSALVSITVNPVNDLPELAPVADRSAVQGSFVSLNLLGSDVETLPSALAYALVSGPAGASVTPSGLLSWTAAGLGAQAFTVRVTDADGGIAERSFAVTVTPVGNAAPTLAAVADLAVDAGTPVSFALSGSDPDDDASSLVYSLVSGPAGASVTPQGAFTWAASGSGSQSVTVRVTDPDGAFDQKTFAITVTPVAGNTAPVLAPIAAQTVEAGGVLIVALSATDSEDAPEALVYSLVSGPAGATVSASGVFSWTAGAAASENATVRVTDSGGLTAERTFAITVTPALNDAPVFTPIADRAVFVGEAVSIALAASDSDDDPSTLTFSLISGPAGMTVTPQGALAWTAAGIGTRAVTVRVTDPHGAFAERSFNIAVSPIPNVAPVLAPVIAPALNEGQALSLQLSASDADGPASALTFSLVSGPAGAAVSAAGLLTWQAADGPANSDFTVRVTDADGGTAERSFVIALADVAPTLTVSGLSSVFTGKTYVVALGSSDPGQDTPIEWIVDWGDGTVQSGIPGNAATASHVYTGAGTVNVRASLRNDDGTFAAAPVALTASLPPLLRATQATIVDGIVTVRVSERLDPAAGSRTMLLTASDGSAVPVTYARSADGLGFTLTRSDGRPIQYDLYTLVVADGALVSLDGSVLDGDANGLAGGTLRTSLLFARATSGSASMPDFVSGPGEHVDVPLADRAGLKVGFTSEGGVKTLTFTVTYDPALLRVDGVLPGADLPAGAKLTFTTEAAAGGKRIARISVASDTAIAAGARWLLSLDATVPTAAPYGSSEVLLIKVEAINAAAPVSTLDDEALQLVGLIDDPDLLDVVPAALPILLSEAAPRAGFDPVTYGFQEAVDKWARDIHATDSRMFKKKTAAPRQAEAANPANSAEPLVRQAKASTPAEAALIAPRIDTFGAPAVLQMAATVPDRGDWLPSFLLDKAAACDTIIEIGTFLPIVLPGLNPPRDDRNAGRRKRKAMADNGPDDVEENA